MEILQESQESVDFVMRLYMIYGLLYFLVLVLDYFLWMSKFRFLLFRNLTNGSSKRLRDKQLQTSNLLFLSKQNFAISIYFAMIKILAVV